MHFIYNLTRSIRTFTYSLQLGMEFITSRNRELDAQLQCSVSEALAWDGAGHDPWDFKAL
ncbi:hypothetical protein MACH17_19680 [Phaeobacter inhibens]|nr:hypothetical protein MACH17_19680 [Phaeobacter inhibens]